MLRIPVDVAAANNVPVWVEIDLRAFVHNVGEFRRLLRPGCELIAVVKANAYGHGMVPIAAAALRAGAARLAVANVAAIELIRISRWRTWPNSCAITASSSRSLISSSNP